MRLRAIFGTMALVLLALPAAAQSASPTPVTPMPVITVTPNPSAWSDLGPEYYGRHYEVYIPLQWKSDDPPALDAWQADARPRNGMHLTPEGDACAADADCQTPMECFNRADAGAMPVKICALPPPY